MSDDLAIATVTAALKRILEKEAGSGVHNFKVRMQPPGTIDDQEQTNMLNLFLYQVTANNGYSNLDLPARNSGGELVQRPRLALNLHYLLTAYAVDDQGPNDLLAHRMLASAMRVLHENPVLTQQIIRDALNLDLLTGYTPPPEIVGSDLEYQVEMVKLTHQSLSLEEITKLWSTFFQTHYHISVAYQATVVLLDGKKRPKPTLPVLERVVHLVPFRHPVIERIEPQIVESADEAGITIIGLNLRSDDVKIKFDDLPDQDTPEPDTVNEDRIVIAIPAKLTAGIKTVQVIHRLKLQPQRDPFRVYKSNVAAFVLAPMITEMPASVAQGSSLNVRVRPAVAFGQRVEFLIGDFTLPVPPGTIDHPIVDSVRQPVEEISVEIPEDFLKEDHPQVFLIRISVDGAASILHVENGVFAGPTIEVTP